MTPFVSTDIQYIDEDAADTVDRGGGQSQSKFAASMIINVTCHWGRSGGDFLQLKTMR